MKNTKGAFGVVVAIVIVVIGVIAGSFIFSNRRKTGIEEGEGIGTQREGVKEMVYEDKNVEVWYLWPEAHEFLSNEEAEIQLLNKGDYEIEIVNPSLTISSSETFDPASEGWESYSSPASREYIDRVIIYNSKPESPLVLNAGEFGKLHYHYLFDDKFAQSGEQVAQIRMNLKIGNKTHKIDKILERVVEPKEHFESSAANPVEEQIKEYGNGSGPEH